MPNSRTDTPDWKVNPTTIATWILIGTTIIGGWVYMYQLGRDTGRQEQTIEQLNQRVADAEKKAAAADTKATYAVSQRDEETGHKPGSKEKK